MLERGGGLNGSSYDEGWYIGAQRFNSEGEKVFADGTLNNEVVIPSGFAFSIEGLPETLTIDEYTGVISGTLVIMMLGVTL